MATTPWLTTEEVAARFRTAPSTVRHWRQHGYGPAGVKVGRKVLYALADVERWETEQQEEQRVNADAAGWE